VKGIEDTLSAAVSGIDQKNDRVIEALRATIQTMPPSEAKATAMLKVIRSDLNKMPPEAAKKKEHDLAMVAITDVVYNSMRPQTTAGAAPTASRKAARGGGKKRKSKRRKSKRIKSKRRKSKRIKSKRRKSKGRKSKRRY